MRKFFASAFGLSLTAALVLGVAFAWSTSGQRSFSNEMGTISIAVPDSPSYNDNIVYDGAGWIPVSYGTFKNTTPANPGVSLHLTGGDVVVTWAELGCNAWMAGKLDVDGSLWAAPGATASGTPWIANLRIDGSPDACQGQDLDYTVNLVAGS